MAENTVDEKKEQKESVQLPSKLEEVAKTIENLTLDTIKNNRVVPVHI